MSAFTLDELDRRIIVATQDGLPLVGRPFAAVAERVGATERDVLSRMQRMAEHGVLKRIAAMPNHYALGYTANGMTVWDVADEHVDELGARVGSLAFVTHCYRRPRHLPSWPYNLFAMVHAGCEHDVEARMGEIAELLGTSCRAHDVLYSRRILKKTGLRLARTAAAAKTEDAAQCSV